jgi:hypothetical protein
MEEHVGYVHERAVDAIRHDLYCRDGVYYWRKGILPLPTSFRDNFDKDGMIMEVTLSPPSLKYRKKDLLWQSKNVLKS